MAADRWGGTEGCFRTGCHGLLLCHSSAVGTLSPGPKAAKCFHASKEQPGLVFIKGLGAMPQRNGAPLGAVCLKSET